MWTYKSTFQSLKIHRQPKSFPWIIANNICIFSFTYTNYKFFTHLNLCVLSNTTPQQTDPNIPAKTMHNPIRPTSSSLPGKYFRTTCICYGKQKRNSWEKKSNIIRILIYGVKNEKCVAPDLKVSRSHKIHQHSFRRMSGGASNFCWR